MSDRIRHLEDVVPRGSRRRRAASARALLVLVACALAWLAGAGAARAELANVPGRDSSIVLTNLGKGKAAIYRLSSDGAKAVKTTLWSGKLTYKAAKVVAGEFTGDTAADLMVLLQPPKGSARLVLFESSGAKMALRAQKKIKVRWADWKRVSLCAAPYGQGADALVMLVGAADGSARVDAFSIGESDLITATILSLPAGQTTPGTVVTAGDVDGDALHELLIAGATASGMHLAAYHLAGGAFEAAPLATFDAAVAFAGARLATGDVDGDTRDELAVLSKGTVGGDLTTVDYEGSAFSSQRASGLPAPRTSSVGVADVLGAGRSQVVVVTAKGAAKATFTAYAVDGAEVQATRLWSGKLRASRSLFGCRSTVTAKLREETVVADTETIGRLTSLSEDRTTLVFSATTAQISHFIPGSTILVVKPCTLAPRGLMCRVEAVVPGDGESVLVTTSEATIQDVYSELDVDIDGYAPLSEDESAGAGSGRAGGIDWRPGKTFSLNQLKMKETRGDVTTELGFQGSCRLMARIRFTMHTVRVGEVSFFGLFDVPVYSWHTVFGYGAGEKLDVTVIAAVKFKKSWEQSVFPRTMIFMVPIGPVLWLSLDVGVKIGASVEGSISASYSISQESWAYSEGEWRTGFPFPSYSEKKENSAAKPRGTFRVETGQLGAKVWLEFTLDMFIDETLGAGVSIGPYVRAVVDPDAERFWALYAGLGGSWSAKVTLLGLELLNEKFSPFTLKEWFIVGADPTPDYVDRTPPVTELLNPRSDWLSRDDLVYYKPPAHRFGWPVAVLKPWMLRLYAVDEGWAQVAKVQLRLDGGAWQSATRLSDGTLFDFSVKPLDGDHLVEYRAVDKKGNVETPQSTHVRIDVTRPTVSVSGGGTTPSTTPVTLAFSAADATSGVAAVLYSVDAGAWRTAPSDGRLTLSGPNGLHVVSYKALDNAGNASAIATVKVNLDVPDRDVTPPVTAALGVDGAWHRTPVQIRLWATDPGTYQVSGVAYTEYRVDGGSWCRDTLQPLIPAPAGTTHSYVVGYRSADNAGNVEVEKTANVNIDTAPPVTSVAGVPASGWTNAPVTLTLSATDAGCGVATTEYAVDGGAWTPGTTVVVSGDGQHTVQYRSTDALGNAESPGTVQFGIDTVAPTSSFTADRAPAWTEAGLSVWFTVTFSYTAADTGGSGVDRIMLKWEKSTVSATGPWTLGGDWTAANLIAFAYNTTGAGFYRLSSYAIDNAGNAQAVQQYVFRIRWPATSPARGVVAPRGAGAAAFERR